jgi:Zn-dependent protease with chaperone function
MARLRGIGPINTAARAVSDRVGRRWIEAAFNAVRLSDRQMPVVYANAVLAARILGMPVMPDVYVSGDRMWDSSTYGSENSAFVILGTALLTNYQGADQLFLLAREMGHCRAGHALWKTVIRFLLGEQGPRHGLGGAGILSALNPAQLVEGALELPLLAWARQAEITADRAGLLAVGDEDIARRVLLSWSLRSVMLYRQINIEAWLQQMDDSDDQTTKLSEVASSSTPYITRRLKLLAGFAASPELKQYRSVIGPLLPAIPAAPAGGPAAAPPPGPPSATASRPQAAPPQESDDLRLACPACKAAMRIPRAVLAGRDTLNVRCANPACGKVTTLKKQAVPALSLQAPPQAAEAEGSMDSSS